ncbi:hypothetical protein MTR67_043131, partial [Solanum verrucosum]
MPLQMPKASGTVLIALRRRKLTRDSVGRRRRQGGLRWDVLSTIDGAERLIESTTEGVMIADVGTIRVPPLLFQRAPGTGPSCLLMIQRCFVPQ